MATNAAGVDRIALAADTSQLVPSDVLKQVLRVSDLTNVTLRSSSSLSTCVKSR